jgi:hypothetical protein
MVLTVVITLRITRFLDFLHRPVLSKLDNTTFRKLYLFPSSGEWFENTYSVGSVRIMLDLSKGLNGVDVSHLTWGRKQIQFPKCFFLKFFKTPNGEQSPDTQYFWVKCM